MSARTAPSGVRHAGSGALIVERLRVASRVHERMRGLLGRPALEDGDGLLITPCNGVHMLFMRYAIDVAFLDKSGRVVAMREALAPWRVVPWVRGAHEALELPAGALGRAGVEVGDALTFTRDLEAAA